MSDYTKNENVIEIVPDFHGFQILYCPEVRKFFGRRGRKHIRVDDSYRNGQSDIEDAILNFLATEERKKRRTTAPAEPFRLWDPKSKLEHTTKLISHSRKGLKLQGDPIDTDAYSSSSILVIPNDVDSGPLHAAVNAMREAASDYRCALKGCTIEIQVKRGSSWSAQRYLEEDECLRQALINAANGETTK